MRNQKQIIKGAKNKMGFEFRNVDMRGRNIRLEIGEGQVRPNKRWLGERTRRE